MSQQISLLKTICLVFTLLFGQAVSAEDDASAAAACSQSGSYSDLDFWLGEWHVKTADGKPAGRNRIEKILNGCAVLEHWTSDSGSSGKSLFYVWQGQWRQVWVTEMASWTGGTKEKHQVNIKPAPGIRFQGSIPLPDGNAYLDRTTLTGQEDGSVRQHIEISTDGGTTWKSSFDAIYTRVGSGLAAETTHRSPQ